MFYIVELATFTPAGYYHFMRYNRHLLRKLELLCSDLDFKVRYEQGHFSSGYCFVEGKKILVINKFFDIEGRINCLLELIPALPIEWGALDEKTQATYRKVLNSFLPNGKVREN